MIFLDIDDTLLDHSRAEKTAALKFGQRYSNEIPQYQASSFLGTWRTVSELHFDEFLNGFISFQDQRRKRMQSIFFDRHLTQEEADERFNEYLNIYEDSWELFPDVLPFLEQNKCFGLAAISDGEQKQQESKLEKTGILPYFSFVLTAESAGISKPSPKIFHEACRLAFCEPSDAYYIGDNLPKDAVAAKLAGLKGIWLNRKKMKTSANVGMIDTLLEFTHAADRV